METTIERNLTRDLLLPTLMFAALGGMTWAVRGSSGYGGMDGCIFAGVMWGAAWWYLAREPRGEQARRYSSGWIVLAMTLGIGFAGGRGWAQWHHAFEGRLYTDYGAGEFVAISPVYGHVWLFIAGAPWAGLGACLLAWCGEKPAKTWWTQGGLWILRLGCAVLGGYLALQAFKWLPQVFLPLHDSLSAQYADFDTNPNLRRVINDNRAAIMHLGIYLGFLAYELGRRDWKNVVLITTVGVVNGLGWSLLQNWTWADDLWPTGAFNWWRCWESSGGISIGIAYGVAYYLVNRPVRDEDREALRPLLTNRRPNLERIGLALGLIYGLGYSTINGLKGWTNLYVGDEDLWLARFKLVLEPTMLGIFIILAIWIAVKRLPKDYDGDVFPNDYQLMWLVLVVQNILGQLVTGPHNTWSEVAFAIYYVLLFLITALIVMYDRVVKHPPRREQPAAPPADNGAVFE